MKTKNTRFCLEILTPDMNALKIDMFRKGAMFLIITRTKDVPIIIKIETDTNVEIEPTSNRVLRNSVKIKLNGKHLKKINSPDIVITPNTAYFNNTKEFSVKKTILTQHKPKGGW